MKTTELHLCECGRVYDDWETYEELPRYGLSMKPRRGIGGKVMRDKDDNIIYDKCHVCRRRKEIGKKVGTLKQDVLDYLKDHDYLTCEIWEELGFKSRQSMGSTMNKLVTSGTLDIKERTIPKKYFLKNA